MTSDKRMSKQEIFAREIEPYIPDVFNRAMQYTRNEADASDLTQVTMLNAFNGLATFKEGTNARAWVLKICYNAFVNNYRKGKRLPNQVDLEERTITPDDDDWITMDGDLFDNLMSDEVEQALSRLNPEERLLLSMVILDEYKYKEIAEEMGMELNTVRTRLFRAKNKLKALLKEYGKEQGYRDKR